MSKPTKMDAELTRAPGDARPWTVVDLFSGAGGFSYGFHCHPSFDVVAAVDAEIGKPSMESGALGCNSTYEANIGISPLRLDLATIDAEILRDQLIPLTGPRGPDVLIVCPPCTGLTRTVPENHKTDDPRNSLVDRALDFAIALKPRVLLMENARELIKGRFKCHYERVREGLENQGYEVHGDVYRLDEFGLPQRRERALVIAASSGLQLRTLQDLWSGYRIAPEATHVSRAIGGLRSVAAGETCPEDPMHTSPPLVEPTTAARMAAIPKDGGSWADLLGTPHEDLLIPSMRRAAEEKKLNRHGDVYGRMWWNRPGPTIKRECAHVGNGRYSHPLQDRLCTVREMALLQGFPRWYQFKASSRSNLYRHVGNAVPPLIAYQLAWACAWILGGRQPVVEEMIMPEGHLRQSDIVSRSGRTL